MAKAICDASHQIHKCSLQFMKLIFPSKDYQITQTDSSKPLQNQQYLQESCSLHPKSSHTNGNCSSQQTDSFAKQSCIVHQNANHKNSECLVQSGMKNPNAQNVLDPILGTKEQLEFWGRCHRCGYPASQLVRQMLLIEGWDTSEIPIHRGKNCPFYNKSDSLTTDKCKTCGWGFHLTCKNKGPKWVGPMKDFDNTNEYGSVSNISSAQEYKSPQDFRNINTKSPQDFRNINTKSPQDLRNINTKSPQNLRNINTRSPQDHKYFNTTSPQDLSQGLPRSPRTATLRRWPSRIQSDSRTDCVRTRK